MRGLLFILVLLGGLLTQPAEARPRGERGHLPPPAEWRPADDEPRNDGHKRAAQIARERYGGRVLGVESVDEGYRVKLIKRGEVRTVTIAPEE